MKTWLPRLRRENARMTRERKHIVNQLPEIPYGIRPQVLLIGNGLNRPFGQTKGKADTDGILRAAWRETHDFMLPCRDAEPRHAFWDLTLPQQVVVATKDRVQTCMNTLAAAFQELTVPDEQAALIRKILDTGFDAILTTNYSLEFEKTVIPNYTPGKAYHRYRTTEKRKGTARQFGLYQCTELPCGGRPSLWHIHGTALRKDSLVMGQMYYGKLMAEAIARANVVNRDFRAAQQAHRGFRPKSWVDFFLIGDVHILGFSLELSETDLWWLLSYKRCAFREQTGAEVYFYTANEKSIAEEKRLLLDCYGVKVRRVDPPEGQQGKQWPRRYHTGIPSLALLEQKRKDEAYVRFYKDTCGLIAKTMETRRQVGEKKT